MYAFALTLHPIDGSICDRIEQIFYHSDKYSLRVHFVSIINNQEICWTLDSLDT